MKPDDKDYLHGIVNVWRAMAELSGTCITLPTETTSDTRKYVHKVLQILNELATVLEDLAGGNDDVSKISESAALGGKNVVKICGFLNRIGMSIEWKRGRCDRTHHADAYCKMLWEWASIIDDGLASDLCQLASSEAVYASQVTWVSQRGRDMGGQTDAYAEKHALIIQRLEDGTQFYRQVDGDATSGRLERVYTHWSKSLADSVMAPTPNELESGEGSSSRHGGELKEDGQPGAPSAAHEHGVQKRLERCNSGEPIALPPGGPYHEDWVRRDPDAGEGEQGGALVHRDGPPGTGPHITEERKTAQRLAAHAAQRLAAHSAHGAGGSDSERSEGASPRIVGHWERGPGVWQVESKEPVADEKGESREVYLQVR